jgi:hypothetical protein
MGVYKGLSRMSVISQDLLLEGGNLGTDLGHSTFHFSVLVAVLKNKLKFKNLK